MFRHLLEGRPAVQIYVDGQAVEASSGDTVASALMVSGVTPFRHTQVSGVPRAPYCGMGACFDCLVTIDGRANRQACLVPVEDGMRIETRFAAWPATMEQPS